jgi:hypothetical protein
MFDFRLTVKVFRKLIDLLVLLSDY